MLKNNGSNHKGLYGKEEEQHENFHRKEKRPNYITMYFMKD